MICLLVACIRYGYSRNLFDKYPLQLQAKLHDYRPTVEGNLETSALGLTFRVTKQGREIDALARGVK